MTQETAMEILKSGQNVFLTGPAGSGKTYVLNKFIDYLKDKKISVAVTASTGIAATHLNGITIHSWSGLGINEALDGKKLKKITCRRQLRNRILRTTTLIIDEISMLSATQLDSVNEICQRIRENIMPFGGMQIVFCGDFFQLPPIKKSIMGNAIFCYASNVWQTMDIKVCYLDEQHRQKDNVLMKVLNDIRRNCVSRETMEIVASCKNKKFAGNGFPAKLFSHNADVDIINDSELRKILEKPYAYVIRSYGKEKLADVLKKSCLSPERLVLKKGAQVMFVKNNFDEGYVNGTMGYIIGFSKEQRFPIVRTFSGKEITAFPATWAFQEDDKELASIRQIPLRLAWAITVHKSQGMSLDAAEVDLSKTFEYGMGYVALSRVRSLAGLNVIGINHMAFETHSEAREMDEKFIKQSDIVLSEIEKMSKDEMDKLKKIFLENNGRDEKEKDKKKNDKFYSFDDIRKEFPKAYMPWEEEEDNKLKKLFSKEKSISELAKIFGRKKGAISARLKKIGIDIE
ncbi:PIF1 family DEAD/DEAH box helicase [Patescibacteria group bacterium]